MTIPSYRVCQFSVPLFCYLSSHRVLRARDGRWTAIELHAGVSYHSVRRPSLAASARTFPCDSFYLRDCSLRVRLRPDWRTRAPSHDTSVTTGRTPRLARFCRALGSWRASGSGRNWPPAALPRSDKWLRELSASPGTANIPAGSP